MKRKNLTLMSITAMVEYVNELQDEAEKHDEQVAKIAKLLVTTEASLKGAHTHINMLEKELQHGSTPYKDTV